MVWMVGALPLSVVCFHVHRHTGQTQTHTPKYIYIKPFTHNTKKKYSFQMIQLSKGFSTSK